MRFLLRSLVLLSLASGLSACGDDSNTNGGPGGGGGDCTCSVTINEDSQELTCGQSMCVGYSGDDRWVTCKEGGPVIGNRLCIQDQWDETTSAEFDCDGRQTCAPDTYCVVRAGPEPRQTECRPIPAGCTPPTSDDQWCDCLEPDAISAGVCNGATGGLASCDVTNPRKTSVVCSSL